MLADLTTYRFPTAVAWRIHTHIVHELCETGELEGARMVLRTSAALDTLKHQDPHAYLLLESYTHRPVFDAETAYSGRGREEVRKEIAAFVLERTVEAPGNRLPFLLGQALKWQRLKGLLPMDGAADHDLFMGRTAARAREDERIPQREARHIKFSKKVAPQCLSFSADGRLLVTGAQDGLIEV